MADPLSPPRRQRRRKLPPLAVDAKGLAVMLNVGKRSIDTYNAAGLIPKPFKLSGRTLWNVAEIRRWLDAGSPDRETWARIKTAKK